MTGPARSRLLVVPYFWPPFTGSVNRWVSMTRHLRELGHSVTVLATDAFGELPGDGDLGVVRVGDLRSARPLRRLLHRGDLTGVSGPGLETPPTALLTKVLVPDAQVIAWLPALWAEARRLCARDSIDCLITSGPPESTHLLGLLLGRSRPAWIADFRDGWIFEPLRDPFPTRAQRALDRRLEQRVARRAELVVGATRPIADDLERRLGARAVYVPNGWDPRDAPTGIAEPPPPSNEGLSTLVYTGTFSGIRGSDMEPFLRALRLVLDDRATPQLRLVHAGRTTAADRELVSRLGVSDAVELRGVLARADALALQRSADALLVLTSRNSSESTGKIFEYLGAGRPIVALAVGNEAERIVRETNSGISVPPDDVDAIAGALRRVASGELAGAYAPRSLEQFTYPGPAQTMSGLIERALELHTSAQSPQGREGARRR